MVDDPNDVYASGTLGAFLIQQKRWALVSRLRKKFIARSVRRANDSDFLQNAIRMFDPDCLIRRRQGDAPVNAPDARKQARTKIADSSVIVFSCDQKYWNAFSERAIQSLWRFNPNQIVHVHIVFPDSTCISSLHEMCSKNGGRFNFSYEEPSNDHLICALPGERAKVYFASSRLFIARRKADAYRRSLLLFDIDAVFLRPFGALFKQLHETEVTVLHFPNSTPLFEFGAGLVYINYSDVGLRFLDDLASHVEICVRRGDGHWFLDQVALYLAFYSRNQIESGVSPMRFARIGQFIHIARIFTGRNTLEAELADIA